MSFLDTLFLGILQGATEFLPISSSGHLFLAEKYLGLTQDLYFEVALHFASLLAVLVFFRKEVWEMIKGIFHLCGAKQCGGKKEDGILGLKLLVATGCTVPVAVFLDKNFFAGGLITDSLVAGTLIFTGILVVISEKMRPKKTQPFSWGLVIFLGLLQGVSVIPGISRSGLTIAFLIFSGVERQLAAQISFLLAIPTILGAAIYALQDAGWEIPLSDSQLLGCVASFLTAIFAIKFMMKIIQKYWIWFAPYCIGVGGLILIFSS